MNWVTNSLNAQLCSFIIIPPNVEAQYCSYEEFSHLTLSGEKSISFHSCVFPNRPTHTTRRRNITACLAEHTHRSAHKHTCTHQHLKMRIFWAADQWGAAALLSAWLGPVEGSQNRAHNSLFSFLDCFFTEINLPFYFIFSDWCQSQNQGMRIGSILTCIVGIVFYRQTLLSLTFVYCTGLHMCSHLQSRGCCRRPFRLKGMGLPGLPPHEC